MLNPRESLAIDNLIYVDWRFWSGAHLYLCGIKKGQQENNHDSSKEQKGFIWLVEIILNIDPIVASILTQY